MHPTTPEQFNHAQAVEKNSTNLRVESALRTIAETEAKIDDELGLQTGSKQSVEFADQALAGAAEFAIINSSPDKNTLVEAAAIAGALEATGDRLETEFNPLFSLEGNGHDDVITDLVESLNETHAQLPNGLEAATVIANEINNFNIAYGGSGIDEVDDEPVVEFLQPEKAKRFDPWAEKHDYETLADLTKGIVENTTKIREAVKVGGNEDLWMAKDAPSRGIQLLISTGEYSPEDLANWAKAQFRAEKEAAKPLEAYFSKDSNTITADTLLESFMDVTLPEYLTPMPANKINELLVSEAFRDSPLLRRAVERVIDNVESNDKEVSGRDALFYIKAKGYSNITEFIHDLPSDVNKQESWQKKIIAKKTQFLATKFFQEDDASVEGESRDQQDFYKTGEFLEFAIGLPTKQSREISWSLRHPTRSKVEVVRAIGSHMEQGIQKDELTELYEGAGLIALERYGTDQLKLMKSFLDGDQEVIEGLRKEEVTVVITDSTEDHNGAFSSDGEKFRTDDRTLFFEITSAENGLNQIGKYTKLLQKHGIKPKTLVLGAHGSPQQSMRFGNNKLRAQEIVQREGVWSNNTALDEMLRQMDRQSEDDPARLILLSCSQGSRDNESGLSMADAIASRVESIDIYAPNVPTDIGSHENPAEGLQFIEGETRRFRNKDGKIEMTKEASIPFRRTRKI